MAKTKPTGDAIALLKADHRKVEDLFEKFEAAKGAERKEALAKEICTELMVHATIEEEIFYPACKGDVEEDLMNEAYVEHDGAKVMIAELLGSNPDSEFYDAKMKVLSEEIKHHVKEEESRAKASSPRRATPGSTWRHWANAWPRARRSCSSSSRPADFRHPRHGPSPGTSWSRASPSRRRRPDTSRTICRQLIRYRGLVRGSGWLP